MAVAKLGTEASAKQTASYSHTLEAGTNRLVLVMCGRYDASGDDFDGCTYGGVAMTEIATLSSHSVVRTKVYALFEEDLPANGSKTVALSVTDVANYYTTTCAFSGVNQTGKTYADRDYNTTKGTSQTADCTITKANSLYIYAVECTGNSNNPDVTGVAVDGNAFTFLAQNQNVGSTLDEFTCAYYIGGVAGTETVTASLSVAPDNYQDAIYLTFDAAVTDITVDVPLGTLTVTGYAPIVSPLVIEIPLGELTLTGYAPTVELGIFMYPGKGELKITGYAPLIGDEELLIRTADGATLLGRLTDGTGVALFSDGENWYALALPKQGT